MQILPIKTGIVNPGDNLKDLLTQNLSSELNLENTVLAVTSKIVSLCEGNYVSKEEIEKKELIKKEAEYILKDSHNKYGVTLTITRGQLLPDAGIDETNSDGNYVMLPKDPFASANKIRRFIKDKFNLKNFGVIITDSTSRPLNWGTTGICIGYSGIKPLKDYTGTEDLFGRKYAYQRLSIVNSLASAVVLAMGEGKEQTPLCLVSLKERLEGEDGPAYRTGRHPRLLNDFQFTDSDPSSEEIEYMKIKPEDDLFHELLGRFV